MKHLDPVLVNKIIRYLIDKQEAMSWQVEAFFGITQMTCRRIANHLELRGLIRKELRKSTGTAMWLVSTATLKNGCVEPAHSAAQSTNSSVQSLST